MVLICNNNILTIEKFHEHRCAEKNEILNIYVKLKWEKKNEPKYHPVKQVEEETYQEMIENHSKFKNKATKYDYSKK